MLPQRPATFYSVVCARQLGLVIWNSHFLGMIYHEVLRHVESDPPGHQFSVYNIHFCFLIRRFIPKPDTRRTSPPIHSLASNFRRLCLSCPRVPPLYKSSSTYSTLIGREFPRFDVVIILDDPMQLLAAMPVLSLIGIQCPVWHSYRTSSYLSRQSSLSSYRRTPEIAGTIDNGVVTYSGAPLTFSLMFCPV